MCECDEKNPKQALDEWLHLARERSLKQAVEYEVEQVYLYVGVVEIPQKRREKLEIELPSLLLRGYESAARKWLELIKERSNKEDIEGLISNLYECLDKAQITAEPWLKKNGSSGDDIKCLKKKGYKSEAESALGKARCRVREGNVRFEVNLVWQYLNKAGLKPEDIKTSEYELNQLLADGDALELRKNKNKAKRKCL